MNRGKWFTDVGYEDDSQEELEGDILEDIEGLLEKKLDQFYTRLLNSNKFLILSQQILQQISQGGTLHHHANKDQVTIKESEMLSCPDISKSNSGSPCSETIQQ